MSDLAGFLAARLDEDEVIAQGAARTDDGLGGNWVPAAIAGKWLSADARVDDHVAAHDPARVLREVKAKRKILREHNAVTKLAGLTEQELGFLGWYREWVLKNLASAYSDHPDYDPSWSVS